MNKIAILASNSFTVNQNAANGQKPHLKRLHQSLGSNPFKNRCLPSSAAPEWMHTFPRPHVLPILGWWRSGSGNRCDSLMPVTSVSMVRQTCPSQELRERTGCGVLPAVVSIKRRAGFGRIQNARERPFQLGGELGDVHTVCYHDLASQSRARCALGLAPDS